MPFKRYPILYLFACAAMGILIQNHGLGTTKVLFIACVLLLFLLAFAWRKHAGLALIGCILVSLSGALRFNQINHDFIELPQCEHGDQRWQAKVDDTLTYKIDSKTRRILQKTNLLLEAQYCNHRWIPRHIRASATLWGKEPVYRGDIIEARLELEDIGPALTRNQENPLARARRQNIQKRARIRSPHALLQRGQGFLHTLDKFRLQTHQHIYAAFDFTHAGLISALVLGDRGGLSALHKDRWARAGMAHLLAISGLHIGLMTLMLFVIFYQCFSLCKGYGERFSLRKSAALSTIPCVVLFCLWTGASIPTLRATLMMTAILLSTIIGRPKSAINACGLAGLCLVFWQPLNLFTPGFILSFGTVLGLLFLGAKFKTRLPLFLNIIVIGLISSSIAALVILPLSLKFFYLFNLLSPLINLVAVPLATWLITPMALVFAPMSFFSPKLADHLAQLLVYPLNGIDALATWGAQSPTWHLVIKEPTWSEVWIYYAVLILLVTYKRKQSHQRLYWALLLTLGITSHRVYTQFENENVLTVYQPYVGQGDAALIVLPNNETILIDAGGSFEAGGWDPGQSVLAPLLRSLGRKHIDLAIVTHPHPDHLNGFLYLSENFHIHEFWWNGMAPDLPILQKILQNIENKGGITKTLPHIRGQKRADVHIEILHPKSTHEHGYFPQMHLNDNSIVLRLKYKNNSIFFSGDIEKNAETHLLDKIKPTDILKAAHHGSRSSSTPAFIEALSPKLVFISVGKNNRFGLPNTDVLERFEKYGVAIRRTDQHGMLTLKTDGHGWKVDSLNGETIILNPK